MPIPSMGETGGVHCGYGWSMVSTTICPSRECQQTLVGMRPYLAKYVRTVTVSLTKCSADTVLSPFVRCLESLPNLETLQIVYASLQMTTTLNDAFKGHTFPRIRNITLPSCAHNILRLCPEVRRVVCSQNDGGKLLTAIQRGCKKVEVARGFKADPALMKPQFVLLSCRRFLLCISYYVMTDGWLCVGLIKAVPSLREVGLDARLDYLVTINGTEEPSIAACSTSRTRSNCEQSI